MAGGGNVDSDQVLALTREIAGIGAKQDVMMESLRELKDTIATKAELKAVEQRVTRIEEDKKHNHAMVISYISAFTAVGSLAYMVFHK